MHIRHVVALIATATVATLALSGVAGAQVETSISEAPAGSKVSVGFTPETDCDGSATVRIDIEMPDGVSDPEPLGMAAWNASVADGVVTYEWGGVGGEDPTTFVVAFTVPDAPGETLVFPTVQTCADASIKWTDADPDADRRAPRVAVVGADQAPEPEEFQPTTTAADGGDEASSTTTTAAPSTADEADQADDSSSSRPVLVIVAVIVIVAAGVGGAAYARRRKDA